MTDIFVSYAHEDELRVKPIVEELQQLGWSVFWDRSIPIGKTWHSQIEKALLESRCVVVVWSRFSITSEWVIEEAEYAKGRGILVPLLIDAVAPPFGFKRIQAADLTDWKNDRSHPRFLKCIEAIESTSATADHQERKEVLPVTPPIIVPQEPQNFIRIRGGIFTMGSPETEVGRSSNETQHQVKVSDFYLCKYTVTFAEFQEFVEASGYRTDAEKEGSSQNWRHGVSGSERVKEEYNHPVVRVSWNDALAYCGWKTTRTGKKFRLPTEAEWEYACRSGTTTPFNTGENLTTAQANYDGNYPYNNNQKGLYRENTVAVDSFEANLWGLYNMHGNVWEWCGDWYGDKYYEECKAKGVVENPAGPETGSCRVIRGGSWSSLAGRCRSAYRDDYTPDDRGSPVGFRLVLVP